MTLAKNQHPQSRTIDITQCNKNTIAFERQNQRRVEADFNGGRLVSDAGLLLLRETDRHIELTASLAAAVRDPRDPAKVQHTRHTMLAQRIHGLAAGYEDLNDHQTLRDDPAIQLCANVDPEDDASLASPSTLCRLENNVTRADCVAMSVVLVDQFIASFSKPPKKLVLDFDATDDPLHGRQEGRFFHGYYDRYCYLPLYVFCGEQLLCAYLRPSNIDASKHSRAITKLLTDRLRKAWPKVKLTIRGDGGFCRWRLMRWCDRNRVNYIFGLPRNKVLQNKAESFMREAEAAYESTGEKQRHFHAITYKAGSWDRERKVIVKAEHLERGPNPRFIVTSLPGDARQLYDKVYCARGEMENRIKEQQLGLFADRTSCSKMIANQFRLLLSSAAYVLMQALRQLALKGTMMAKAQVSTIRTKLVKIAARVTVSVRRVMFHLSSTCPLQELFRHVAARLSNPSAKRSGDGDTCAAACTSPAVIDTS